MVKFSGRALNGAVACRKSAIRGGRNGGNSSPSGEFGDRAGGCGAASCRRPGAGGGLSGGAAAGRRGEVAGLAGLPARGTRTAGVVADPGLGPGGTGAAGAPPLPLPGRHRCFRPDRGSRGRVYECLVGERLQLPGLPGSMRRVLPAPAPQAAGEARRARAAGARAAGGPRRPGDHRGRRAARRPACLYRGRARLDAPRRAARRVPHRLGKCLLAGGGGRGGTPGGRGVGLRRGAGPVLPAAQVRRVRPAGRLVARRLRAQAGVCRRPGPAPP